MSREQVHARNSLGLGQRELDAMLDQIDSMTDETPTLRRTYVRWAYRNERVVLRLEHPGGSTVDLPLASRNLSRDGVSLLHSSYVHQGSRCVVLLDHLSKGSIEVRGEIVRCNHLVGRVHEVGVRFDDLIQTKEFLDFDPMNECYSVEAVDPAKLAGRVLIVDVDELECKLIRKHLVGTSLRCESEIDPDKAVEKAAKEIDVILTEFHLGSSQGTDLIRELRANGVRAPVIIVSCDKTDASRDEMRQAGASAFVSKPIERDQLLRALAEFLLADGDGGPMFTSLADRDAMFEFVPSFVETMGPVVERVEQTVEADDLQQFRVLCMRLGSQAPSLGFVELGRAADEACHALDASSSVSESDPEIQRLLAACRRVRERPAA